MALTMKTLKLTIYNLFLTIDPKSGFNLSIITVQCNIISNRQGQKYGQGFCSHSLVHLPMRAMRAQFSLGIRKVENFQGLEMVAIAHTFPPLVLHSRKEQISLQGTKFLILVYFWFLPSSGERGR
jgi:hypothetical protein